MSATICLVRSYTNTPFSVTNSPLRVLILGATGVFGSRLVERIAREPGFALILAARNRVQLKTLAARYCPDAGIRVIDRDQIQPCDVADVDVIVDMAGPFQNSGVSVIHTAISARVHYFDLADGRDFVGRIGQFDEAAKKAGLVVASGVSSIPALSHAVIDRLTAGWQQIDLIKVGIFPGNRAPRGLAVVQSILSYAGKPVKVFRDGRWQQLSGWGFTHRWRVKGVGNRWASICDTPDQDLLVKRYQPIKSAEFFAGVELSVMHLGLVLLCLPVRLGLIHSLRPAAKFLLRIAVWLRPFGSDRGGMAVIVSGLDSTGLSVRRVWQLEATGEAGPYVPVLPCLAMLRRLRDGVPTKSGAYACAGILTLDEMDADFDNLRIARVVS